MNDERTRILLIEDDPEDARLIQEMLDEAGNSWDLEVADRLSTGLKCLANGGADLVLLDLGLPDSQGLETLTRIQAQAPEAAAVVMANLDDEALAIEGVREGAQGYLVKGQVDGTLLARTIRLAVERRSVEGTDKRAEETPWGSRGDFRDLIDNASDLIQSISPDGRILYVNRAWQEALGYTREEARRLSISDIIHPDDREHCMQAFKRVLSGEKVRRVEARFMAKDGRTISVEGSTNCKFADGKPAWTRGIFRDVSERQRAEEVLQRAIAETARSQRMILALGHAAQAVQRARTPDAVYRTLGEELLKLGYHMAIFDLTDDREHIVLRHVSFDSTVLQAAEKLTGLSVEGCQLPIMPGSVHERVLAEGRTIFCQRAAEAVADLTPAVARPLAERIASMLRSERSVFAPLMAEGEAYGILAVTGAGLSKAEVPAISAFANQTAIALENARTRQSLESSKRFLEKVIDSSPDPIFIKDRQHRILNVNRALCDIYGLTKEEVAGKTDHDLFPREQADRFWETTEAAFVTGQVVDVPEESATDRDGNVHCIHTRKAPVQDERGEISSVVGVIRDITERKRTEEALQESEARFKAIFLSSTDGIVVWDRDYNYLYANRASIDLAGTTPDKVIGKSLRDGLGHMPDRMRLWMSRVDRVFETGEPMHLEEASPLGDGLAHREYTVSPVVDENGHIFAVAVVTRDITERKQAEETLHESEERYRSLFEQSRDAIVVSNQAGEFVDFNQAALDLYGCTREEMLSTNARERYVDPADRDRFRQEMDTKGYVKGFEARVCKDDGTEMDCVFSSTVQRASDGSVLYRGIVRDITERKRAEQTLREGEERYRILFEQSRDAILVTNREGETVDFNQAALDLFGCIREELMGQNALDRYVDHAEREGHFQEMDQKGYIEDFEVKLRKKDGTELECLITATETRASDGSILYQGIIRDITERKRAEETIRHMAYHDALTGLPNRPLFDDRLAQALAQAKRNRRKLAVMLVDLDNFKQINDALGHEAGDRALKKASDRLKGALRNSDTVARWGGDEFIVLLPEISRVKDGARVAHKVLEDIQRPLILEGRELQITASIGIAVYPQDGEEGNDLISGADDALYDAKRSGGNRCECYRRDEGMQKPDAGIAAATRLPAG